MPLNLAVVIKFCAFDHRDAKEIVRRQGDRKRCEGIKLCANAIVNKYCRHPLLVKSDWAAPDGGTHRKKVINEHMCPLERYHVVRGSVRELPRGKRFGDNFRSL